ncbi:hypothetical protein Tco_0427910 [Tanacetum coccineum]
MADLIFADSHNMVAYLEKLEDNADFAKIVDFLNASPIRKATEISQSSKPTTLVADETVHEERGDSVERAATTATILNAEQGSGGSPRFQEAMGDTIAQTRSERVSIPSYDSSLLGVNTPESDEERIEHKELMDMCTKLSDRVLDLENVKNAQALEIQKLKKRVKKLEKKKKSRTPQLKRRLFKFQEHSKTQGSAPVTTAGISVSTAEPSTPPPPTTTTTTPIKDEDLTIAQTLIKMKSEKSKAKGVTMQEPSESGTRLRVPPLQIDSKDKGKVKMVEPENPKKKKDQIEYDVDEDDPNIGRNEIEQGEGISCFNRGCRDSGGELDEEARLEREREEEASKAANIAEWDDVQAMMDADYELAAKLQA